jgi:hypothetical protein
MTAKGPAEVSLTRPAERPGESGPLCRNCLKPGHRAHDCGGVAKLIRERELQRNEQMQGVVEVPQAELQIGFVDTGAAALPPVSPEAAEIARLRKENEALKAKILEWQKSQDLKGDRQSWEATSTVASIEGHEEDEIQFSDDELPIPQLKAHNKHLTVLDVEDPMALL